MNDYRDVLLCSEDIIKTYTNISDNTAGKYIQPSIYMAQHQDLEECLGTKLVRKIQELIGTNQINRVENEPYKTLLDDYITDYLAYATIVRLIPIVSFKIGNMGVVRTEDEKVISMPYNEVFNLKDYYKQQADYLQYRLQRYLIANYNLFNELKTHKTVDELQSNLYSAANVPIWLGGSRNNIK